MAEDETSDVVQRRIEDRLAIERAQDVVEQIDRTLERSRRVAERVLPQLRRAGVIR